MSEPGRVGGAPAHDEIMRRIIERLYLTLKFYADRTTYRNILIYPESDAGPFSEDCRAPEGWAFVNYKLGDRRHRKHYGVKARETIKYLEDHYGSLDIFVRENKRWKGRPRPKKTEEGAK